MNETIKRIQNGEKELLEGFILENYQYIYSYLEPYDGVINDFEDLKQEVLKEFVKSVYGYKFKYNFLNSYAKIKLLTCIERYLSKHLEDFINYDDRYAFCVRMYELCKRRIGYEPSIDDIRKTLFINETNAYILFMIINNPNIYNEKYVDKMEYIDFEEEKSLDNVERDEMAKLIKNTTLTKRQKELLLFHYGFYNGETYNFSEMARGLNSDRQIYSFANKKLLKSFKRKLSE